MSIEKVRYLLGNDPIPTDPSTLRPTFSSWITVDTPNVNMCADLPSMLVTTGLKRDNGTQQLALIAEKQDAFGNWGLVERIILTKRDQRCPTGGFQNLDQGPC